MIRKRYLFLILAVLVLGISLTYIFAEIKSEEYEEMLKELSPELCAILDRIEEAWYLMKEAELQATYMQGISDGMDMQKEKLRRVC